MSHPVWCQKEQEEVIPNWNMSKKPRFLKVADRTTQEAITVRELKAIFVFVLKTLSGPVLMSSHIPPALYIFIANQFSRIYKNICLNECDLLSFVFGMTILLSIVSSVIPEIFSVVSEFSGIAPFCPSNIIKSK